MLLTVDQDVFRICICEKQKQKDKDDEVGKEKSKFSEKKMDTLYHSCARSASAQTLAWYPN